MTIRYRESLITKQSEWQAVDPVLLPGDLAISEDTGVVKVGNGVSPWSDLPGISGGSGSVPISVVEEASWPIPDPDSGTLYVVVGVDGETVATYYFFEGGPPVAQGSMADQSWDQGSAASVDAAPYFSGAVGGAWSVTGAGATISAAGIITIPTGSVLENVPVVVSYTNSGGTASQAFQVSVTPAVVPVGIDSVVIVGQSLEQSMMGRSLTTPHAGATALMQAQGIDIPVYGYGFSGQRWDNADDYYLAARAAHPNALIMMHMGVNDAWQTKPYATLTSEVRATMDSSLADIAAAAAGDTRFYHSSVAFCSFAAPLANAPVFMDPSQGVRPYNENIVIPWIAANWPHAIGAGGRPKVDPYRFILSDFENILQVDGVHWTEPGNALILPWLVGEVAKIIKGQTPAAIPERIWSPPTDWLAVVNFGGSSSVIPTQIMGADVRAGTGFALRDVYDVDTGLTVRATTIGTPPGASLGDNTGGRSAGMPGGWTRTLYCAHIAARNILAASEYPVTITLSGCAPGAVYEIGLLGTRNLTGPQQMQISDGVTTVAWDCCEDPPVERHLTAAATAGGIITLTASSVSGAQIHLSGISVRPLA